MRMSKNDQQPWTSFEFIFEAVNTNISWASLKTLVMRMSKNVQKPWNQFRIYFLARQHQHLLSLIENYRNAHVEKW